MKRIYARKCDIVITSKQTEEQFINANHYQGYIPSKVCYALKYEDEIVEMMTFSAPRYNKSYDWELLRLCTKKDYYVVGGASKLFNAFTDNFPAESVVSYCNRDKFSGNVYKELGFKSNGITKGYHYEKDGEIYNRQSFTKKNCLKLWPEFIGVDITERKIMELKGYNRIDDTVGQETFAFIPLGVKFYIYKIECNNFTYIGQHKYLSTTNDNYKGSGTIITRLTHKYSCSKTILIDNIATQEEADELEKLCISADRAVNGYLNCGGSNCNIKDGGRGYIKINRISTQGRKGTPHTEEFKERQRQRMLGVHRTEEAKLRVSLANKGRKHTEEWKEHNSEIMKEQYANGRKVVGCFANPSSGGKANADKVRQIKDKIHSEGLLCAEDIPKRQRALHKVAYTIGQIKAYKPL